MSHQISLLDYVLNEQEIKYIKRRNLTIETVPNASPKYSANSKLSNSSIDEFVSMRMFRSLITQIEDRLNDLDMRIENKEKLQHLNESLTCLRHCNHNPSNKQKQDLERTQQSVDESESRVAVAPKRQQSLAQLTTLSNKKQDINETGLLNRLNLFEKKLLQLDEKLSKFIKEGELFRKDVESKIESKLKSNQWSLDKFSDQTKDLLNRINDIGGNHKEMTQHILKVKDDLSYYQSSCLHFNEQNMGQLNKVDSAVTILNNVVCKINDELNLYTPAVDQIGIDLLVIMKMYKDMLQIIYKK